MDTPSATQRIASLIVFPLALLLAIVIAALASEPPAVRTAAAPGGIDTARAMADLRVIAREPHLTGSPANARVRDALVARLTAAGLDVSVQRGFAVRQSTRKGRSIATAPVENIVALLPGRDRTVPAVAVMAHYDSVPFSYGASDDGAGSVALLETARALARGPRPARDVLFILTDGEELGLTGAQLFFDDHPQARRIGVVVNAEARGSKGRAIMFQTSPGNAQLVDLWASHAISPTGNSLSDAIYRILPNDTDLSVSLGKEVPGINAAFLAGHFDYHSTTDTAAHIDPRTLQHLGDYTLTTTRALAMARALPGGTGDSIFFDLFGTGVVRYPPWFGWLPLLLALVGAGAAMRGSGVSALRLAGATLGVAALTMAVAAVSHFWGGLAYGGGVTALRENLAEAEAMLWVYAGLVLAAALLARPGRAMMLGATLLLIMAGVAAQIFLVGGGFLFGWPALAAAVIALIAQRRGAASPAATIAVLTLGVVVLALVFQLIAFAFVSVGLLSSGVLATALPFGLALLGPALAAWLDRRAGRIAGAAVLAATLAGGGWLWASDGFSARYPRPGDFFALSNLDSGRSYWASTSGAGELPPGAATSLDFAPLSRGGVTVVPAPGLAPPGESGRPAIAFTPEAGGGRIAIATQTPPRMLLVAVRPSARLSSVTLNGRAVVLEEGEWTFVSYRAAQPAGLTLDYRGPPGTRIEMRYLLAMPGLPAGAPRGAGLVNNWTQLTGTHSVVGSWSSDGRRVVVDPVK